MMPAAQYTPIKILEMIDKSEPMGTYHGLRHTGKRPILCNPSCQDELCKEIGCLNVQAWKFRELIMKGLIARKNEAE